MRCVRSGGGWAAAPCDGEGLTRSAIDGWAFITRALYVIFTFGVSCRVASSSERLSMRWRIPRSGCL
jgi:hypothetical protein